MFSLMASEPGQFVFSSLFIGIIEVVIFFGLLGFCGYWIVKVLKALIDYLNRH